MVFDAPKILKQIGAQGDDAINLIDVAFAFAIINSEFIVDIDKYQNHVGQLSQDLKAQFEILSAKMNSDNVYIQAQALEDVFAKSYGYLGDDMNYNDVKNINIFQVIDRRLGLPITLSLLAIVICRMKGWNADGINLPGHFIMRLEKDGERLMIDPFQGCKILEAKDLRIILKRVMGPEAELSANYYDPCTNRDILLRLQNNLKYRHIDNENYAEALHIINQMAWIAPNDNRLSLDKAVLLSRVGQPTEAIKELEHYINQATDDADRADAIDFMRQLQSQLN